MSVAVGLAVRVVRLGYKPEGHGAENDSWLAGSSIDEGHCGSLWWGGYEMLLGHDMVLWCRQWRNERRRLGCGNGDEYEQVPVYGCWQR